MKKIGTWIIVVLALVTAGFFYVSATQNKIDELEADLTKKELSMDSTTQLNDSLVARIAVGRIEKDSLQASLAAAERLNADLVAAANIELRPEGSHVVDTVPVVIEGETRIAEKTDTLATGTMYIRVKAPPFPSELEMEYEYTPDPINVNVSLLTLKDDTAIFTATWAGGKTEISAPFAKLPAREPWLAGYVAAGYEILTKSIMARAGVQVRTFWGLYPYGELQQVFPNAGLDPKYEYDSSVFVGINKRFALK